MEQLVNSEVLLGQAKKLAIIQMIGMVYQKYTPYPDSENGSEEPESILHLIHLMKHYE